jgi:phosphoserine phosphatase RsbU/P
MASLRDQLNNQDIPLHGKITLLGRDPSCDIVVNTERTSWRHALIFHTGKSFSIEDLDSVNGTYVNGKRIVQRAPLQPGDRLEISGFQAVLQDEGPGNGRPALTPAERVANDILPQSTPMSPPNLSVSVDYLASALDEDLAGILTSVDAAGVGRLEVRPEAKLHAILEISQALSNTLHLDAALPRVLDRLFGVFPHADRGFILLRDPDSGQLLCKATRTRAPVSDTELAVSQGVINHALQTGRAILSADASHDERFDPLQSIHRFRIGSIMCVPMLGQSEERLGIVQIDTRDKRHPFCEEDLEVLVSATMQTARAVELASWHKEQSDLEAAIRIQKSFLPSRRPDYADLRFFDYYSAARLIGGDYYDYISLPGNRLAVTLGDVSGKGVAAALLMARLSAAVRVSLATESAPREAVACLNGLMMQAEADRFITFVVMIIDRNDYSMTVVNAGHPPPLLRAAAGGLSEVGLAQVGLPLGIYDRPYEETFLHLGVGDSLVLYTDGITEARNPSGDFYDQERLMRIVAEAPDKATSIGDAILADVKKFAAGRSQSDDLTLVGLTRER